MSGLREQGFVIREVRRDGHGRFRARRFGNGYRLRSLCFREPAILRNRFAGQNDGLVASRWAIPLPLGSWLFLDRARVPGLRRAVPALAAASSSAAIAPGAALLARLRR